MAFILNMILRKKTAKILTVEAKTVKTKTKTFFRCDSISTFDHVTHSVSQSVTTLYQNRTKKTFITYMATFRNY